MTTAVFNNEDTLSSGKKGYAARLKKDAETKPIPASSKDAVRHLESYLD